MDELRACIHAKLQDIGITRTVLLTGVENLLANNMFGCIASALQQWCYLHLLRFDYGLGLKSLVLQCLTKTCFKSP